MIKITLKLQKVLREIEKQMSESQEQNDVEKVDVLKRNYEKISLIIIDLNGELDNSNVKDNSNDAIEKIDCIRANTGSILCDEWLSHNEYCNECPHQVKKNESFSAILKKS